MWIKNNGKYGIIVWTVTTLGLFYSSLSMIQIKRLVSSVAVGALAFLPLIASAQGNPFDRAQDSITGSQGVQQNAGLGGGSANLETIIGRIINVVLGFLGIILLFYILMAGFRWMTAGGDPKQTQEAKDMIKNAVIGMVIIVAGFAISTFVIEQLGILSNASTP